MSKFTFAFTKETKQIFVPNGDKTRYVEISGCPIESVNGTYYQMDPITINDKTYNYCFTNGIYLFITGGLHVLASNELYEFKNSILTMKFHTGGHYIDIWYNSETLEFIQGMIGERIGDWQYNFD